LNKYDSANYPPTKETLCSR